MNGNNSVIHSGAVPRTSRNGTADYNVIAPQWKKTAS